MNDERSVTLWQMRPVWGLPNPSPFCMKVETWLRMTGIAYVAREIAGPPKSKSGKVPYIERPDGSLLSDSSVILETLGRERGVTLDAFWNEQQRAHALLVQRLFEEELYFIALYDRWVDEAGWAIARDAYFGHFPWPLRKLVVPLVRQKVIAAARGQGVSRLSESCRRDKAIADVRAISTVLADQPFFLGQPSSLDATAYAFLANGLWAPIASVIRDEIQRHGNLVAYCDRMKDAYFRG